MSHFMDITTECHLVLQFEALTQSTSRELCHQLADFQGCEKSLRLFYLFYVLIVNASKKNMRQHFFHKIPIKEMIKLP